jgi:hypothetical protein
MDEYVSELSLSASIGCAGVTLSHEVAWVCYYGVLEYVAGSQNVGLEGKDQECVVGSQNVGLDGKGQECVVVYCLGSGSERTVCGLGSEREG